MTPRYQEYPYTCAEPGWAQGYLLPPLVDMLDGTTGPVLDLGCGNGAIARALISKGYDVYGVDASSSGITLANDAEPGRFFVADLSEGQLPDAITHKRYSAVISTEVIEHLYDPRALVKLARSLLSPGGHLIVTTPYHGYLKNLAMALAGKLDSHFTVLWDGGHIKFFSRKTLAALLVEQEFEVVRFVGAGRLPYMWKSMVIKAKAA
jgi:2-polyprenyl-3-methyl-5-hydroxy-6-metoxy-1,4-benzoquinol methylase